MIKKFLFFAVFCSYQITCIAASSTAVVDTGIQPEKIENFLPDLDLLFVRRYGNYNQSPREAWEAMMEFINVSHLDCSKVRYFGISYDNPDITQEDKLRYDAAILVPEETSEAGEIKSQVLKGGKYAVFTHYGAYENLEKTFNGIFSKWLPEGKETFDETRQIFCEYFNMGYIEADPTKLITKLYIPLK